MPPHGPPERRRSACIVDLIKKNWCPPPNPSTSRQSQKASNVDEALQTRESRRMLRYAGQAESELRRAREDLKVVEWIEFKPRRGTRSTKLNRSNWSSDDLKEKRNVADRTVAVALSWCAPL